MITIFTPAYNRAYILPKLYNSLILQTNKDFEWLIVDDGSTDNTEELINSYILESKIEIRYVKQLNGGKHRAINRGVQMAKGELFFIVDSDDYLSDNAVDRMNYYYYQIKDEDSFVGVSGIRIYPDGSKIGGSASYTVLDSNAVDFRLVHKVAGDMSEAYKIDILRKFPFPEIEGEKFCPEAVVWNRIAKVGKLRYFNEGIYICNYLPDGLTAKITKLRMDSPEASLICYSELTKMNISFVQKIKSGLNFWRFAFCSERTLFSKYQQIGFYNLILMPFGYIMHMIDNRKNR